MRFESYSPSLAQALSSSCSPRSISGCDSETAKRVEPLFSSQTALCVCLTLRYSSCCLSYSCRYPSTKPFPATLALKRCAIRSHVDAWWLCNCLVIGPREFARSCQLVTNLFEVPWGAGEMTWESKLATFFDNLDLFDQRALKPLRAHAFTLMAHRTRCLRALSPTTLRVRGERLAVISRASLRQMIGFYTCVVLLLRCIGASAAVRRVAHELTCQVSTGCNFLTPCPCPCAWDKSEQHPRIGVLIKTVYYSLDDLFHLGLLVVMCLASFLILAYSQFGVDEDA